MRSGYWTWLFRGINASPGIKKFLDYWLPVHVLVGWVMAIVVSSNLSDAAQGFLLPLTSIFVGLSFAWAGNAQALLQTEEIERVTKYHPDGMENYVYTYQTAILVILITTVSWGLAAIGMLNFKYEGLNFFVESCLYFLASLSLRECWHVILGSQLLVLTRHKIRKTKQ